MIDQLCGADHGDGVPCDLKAGHIQECPVCGRITYLQIHNCPGAADDDHRAAGVHS
jgi:hypothetical protein